MSLFAIFKKTHFSITIPINGCSSLRYNKAWRHKSECVKIINLDAFLISYRALMYAQISAVKIDAELDNIMKHSVSDGKTVAHATEFPSCDPSV